MTTFPVFTPEFFQHPYPMYQKLREEHPVHRTRFPFTDVDVWLVSRYEDVREGLRDARLSSDYRNAPPAFHAAGLAFGGDTVAARTMLNLDAPDHTRVRKLATATFSARRIAEWAESIETIVAELLDAVPAGEAVDVLDRVATPLSVKVICEIIGAPPSDAATLRNWADAIFAADPAQRPQAAKAVDSLIDYSAALIADKKRHLDTDLISDLIRATPELISEDELLATVLGLVVAGYETTIALAGDIFLALLDHPEQAALLRRDPSLIEAAIEEVLRYDGPTASSFWRFPTEDLEIAGIPIATGEPVLFLIGSAHRDPARYPDPDRFDILREDKRHLAFGHGIHHCLGAQLARLESRILLTRTLERFPSMALAIPRADVVFKPSLIVRGPAFLPVVFTK
ncbi:cytochrome P450 family protein [Rhizohabitans arisaemae]|uniref:cytochrome P450 family protein n=1 Tax=Rhizohabitans arisaemae TaxID=2720610 RepID=UPI0024B18D6D|nr:cytochrome P450 [Rhizohabitans arisaemae]